MGGSAIRALVCGYAAAKRRTKLLAMLQAFVDDSASTTGDRRLVMAALVHSAEDWEAFSDAWDAELKREPAIDYFHMVEAQNRRGQFQGWSEAKRTRKVFALAEVIKEFGPLSVDSFISLRDHKAILKPHAPFGLSSPYYPTVFVLACGVARACQMLGAEVPCDFVFDRQDNVSKHVQLFWEYTISQQPPEWGQFISASPVFRDDKDVLPLQAADLLAWHTRRGYEENYPSEYEGILKLIRAEGFSYSLEITNHYLHKWAEGMKKIPGAGQLLKKGKWNAVIEEILENGGIMGHPAANPGYYGP